MNISDVSRFRGAALLAVFFSTALLSACEVDLLALMLDGGRTALFEVCVLGLTAGASSENFPVLLTADADCGGMGGRFAVLRFNSMSASHNTNISSRGIVTLTLGFWITPYCAPATSGSSCW